MRAVLSKSSIFLTLGALTLSTHARAVGPKAYANLCTLSFVHAMRIDMDRVDPDLGEYQDLVVRTFKRELARVLKQVPEAQRHGVYNEISAARTAVFSRPGDIVVDGAGGKNVVVSSALEGSLGALIALRHQADQLQFILNAERRSPYGLFLRGLRKWKKGEKIQERVLKGDFNFLQSILRSEEDRLHFRRMVANLSSLDAQEQEIFIRVLEKAPARMNERESFLAGLTPEERRVLFRFETESSNVANLLMRDYVDATQLDEALFLRQRVDTSRRLARGERPVDLERLAYTTLAAGIAAAVGGVAVSSFSGE